MNIPTKRVVFRPYGRVVTINASDFDPKLHIEVNDDRAEAIFPESMLEKIPADAPDDFVIAEPAPLGLPGGETSTGTSSPEPAPPAEPVEDAPAAAGKGKGKGKK
jgi:hypothetical protein